MKKNFLIYLLMILTSCLFIGGNSAKAATAGDLIKSPASPAVYYLGDDGKKYVFPDENVFFSWYENFSTVTTVSLSEIQSYGIGGNVVVRAGTKLIQFVAINPNGSMIIDDPKIYAVEPNGVRRWITTAAIAEELYGNAWEQKIYPVPNYLFVNYPLGEPIAEPIYPDGTFLKQAGTSNKYYINQNGEKQLLSDGAIAENMFQLDYLIVTEADLSAYEDGSQILSAQSGLTSVVANTPANQINNSYYVSISGSDYNNGSLENPFLTVAKAASTATAGDMVYLRAGVYQETVRPQNSGTENNYISFTSYPGETAEVRGTEGYGFYLGDGVSYIKIDNLTITRGLGAGVITVYPENKNYEVVHGAGVKIDAAHHNLITNNKIYDNDIGIFLAPYGSEDNASTYNQIIGNTIYHSGEAGIRNKRSDYTIIDGNVIYENGFKNNPVYSEPAAGITFYCANQTTIANNTIYGNSTAAIEHYFGTDSASCYSQGTLIENNILAQTSADPVQSKLSYGEKIIFIIPGQEISDTSHVYKNNTFYNSEPGSIVVLWGQTSQNNSGTLFSLEEFNNQINILNSQSGNNTEEAYNPIQ